MKKLFVLCFSIFLVVSCTTTGSYDIRKNLSKEVKLAYKGDLRDYEKVGVVVFSPGVESIRLNGEYMATRTINKVEPSLIRSLLFKERLHDKSVQAHILPGTYNISYVIDYSSNNRTVTSKGRLTKKVVVNAGDTIRLGWKLNTEKKPFFSFKQPKSTWEITQKDISDQRENLRSAFEKALAEDAKKKNETK